MMGRILSWLLKKDRLFDLTCVLHKSLLQRNDCLWVLKKQSYKREGELNK